jgi:hypothetical protein
MTVGNKASFESNESIGRNKSSFWGIQTPLGDATSLDIAVMVFGVAVPL